jgi:glycerol-3-phosphate O-acyltransferase
MPDQGDAQPSGPARLTPFDPGERTRVVQSLVTDSEVLEAVSEERAATGHSDAALAARVRRYAEEIVPQYNARLHHRIAYRLARRLATLLFRVRVGYVDEGTLQQASTDTSVVFVINHRSNMDYVLVAFLAAERVALSFAVGEWARIWPLDNLLRGLGAFFVRRNSRDRLYRKVLERYVQIAIDHGVTQAVFPEGGLSRDGRLRPPKLGLLSYATRRFSRASPHDLIFVPVALNYDRVLEDRTLLVDLEPVAVPSSRVRTALSALAWIAKNAGLYVRGRLHRFGYACVNFGPPLSLRGYLDERGLDLSTLGDEARAAETEHLGRLLMNEISEIVPVTPVSLVASAILSFDGEAASEAELADRVLALGEELQSVGARLYVPRGDTSYFLAVGIRMLKIRRLIAVESGVCRIAPGERALVQYYASSIAHFFEHREQREQREHRERHSMPAGDRAPRAPAASVARAVILVHGLARTWRSMTRLADALAAAGYAVYNWDYPSRKFGILQLVDALEAYAHVVARSSGRVDFVTHSMGGLLARGALARGTLSNVGRLVMLAPPNQGSEIASKAKEYEWARGYYGRALVDLSRDKEFGVVDRLGSPGCPFGIVAGTRSFHLLQPASYYSSLTRPPGSHDGTVQVEETTLPGMADFITVNANHTFIVDHDEAIRQTLYFLDHGRFDH